MDLLLLAKHHDSSEDLAGKQCTCQSCQACHLQSATVAPERVKYEKYFFLKGQKQQGREDDMTHKQIQEDKGILFILCSILQNILRS